MEVSRAVKFARARYMIPIQWPWNTRLAGNGYVPSSFLGYYTPQGYIHLHERHRTRPDRQHHWRRTSAAPADEAGL